jgi:WD40 repeat protein
VADVFLSYSRRDSDFVARLADALGARGKNVWVDTEGIRDGEVFPAALRNAVEQSDGFVFVISPDSVDSPYCGQEIDHALELGKRIVPLVLRRVPDEQVPEPIRIRNWIPFDTDTESNFEGGIDRLITALDTDLEHTKAHTRWLVKALDWENRDRDSSRLVRGSELTELEQWVQQAAGKEPEPTPLQHEFAFASRAAASRRLRMLMGAMGIALAIAIALAVVALTQRNEARHQTKVARHQANVARSRELASLSERQQALDPELGILLGMQAVKTEPTPQAMLALREALDNSALKASLGGHSAPVAGVAFSGDGKLLATVGFPPDSTIPIRDARTHRVLRVLKPDGTKGPSVLPPLDTSHAEGYSGPQNPNYIKFLPGGHTLAVGLDTGGVALYDADGGRFTHRLGGPQHVNQITLTRDGSRLMMAGFGRPTLWDVQKARLLRTFPVAANTQSRGALSPDGRWAAAGAEGKSLTIFDPRSGRRVLQAPGRVEALAFAPDGSRLVYGGPDARLTLLDLPSGRRRVIARFPRVIPNRITWTRDGKRVAVALTDGTARIWDVQTGAELDRFTGHRCCVLDVAFNPGDTLLASGALDHKVDLWTTRGNAAATASADGAVFGVALAGRNAAVAVHNGASLLLRPGRRPQALPKLRSASAVARGPGGTTFVFAGPGDALHFVDANSGRIARTLQVDGPRAVAVSPDGNHIAVGTAFSTRVVDVHTGKDTSDGSGEASDSVALVGNRMLARATQSQQDGTGSLVLERVPGLKHVRLQVSPKQYLALAGSADGSTYAASEHADPVIHLYSAKTGKVVRDLLGHSGDVQALAFAPDGRLLASASSDNTVRIWNTATGDELREIRQRSPAFAVSFSADGSKLVLGDADGTVQIWPACPGCFDAKRLLAIASHSVTRRLTPSERRTFRIG